MDNPDSPTKPETDEISMENFEKIVDSTQAIKEKSVRPVKRKASLNSQFAVRMSAVGRKMPTTRQSGWSPGQAARRRNFFIAVLLGALAIFFVFQTQSNPTSKIKSAAVNILPGSDAYKAGYNAGSTFRSNVDYNSEFLKQWGSEVDAMLKELGQSPDNMTEELLGQIADASWTSAALQAGIMENTPENRADYRRGMIDGYFK
jgi:hypothetical protein